jgi:uncharacterized protein
VTSAAIVRALARELSAEEPHVQRLLELLSTGLKAPYVARFRRAEIGGIHEGNIRRLERRRRQLEELDRRRESLLRSIGLGSEDAGAGEETKAPSGEHAAGAPDADELRAMRETVDRFELEDLFLPHRRPEPEVQLALDRGLGELADRLVAPAPRASRAPRTEGRETHAASPAAGDASAGRADDGAEGTDVGAEPAPAGDGGGAAADLLAEPLEPYGPSAVEAQPLGIEGGEGVHGVPPAARSTAIEGVAGTAAAQGSPAPAADSAPAAHPEKHGVDLGPELARICAEYVNPDRGVHSEMEALEGAMRILSDRLGRHPALRRRLRRLVHKEGRVVVRPLVEEKRLGRHRALSKLRASPRQIQGHRLLALRQALMQRIVNVHVELDHAVVLPKVRTALEKHVDPRFAGIVDTVAERAFTRRLLPAIEDETRAELRERAEEEAMRLLAQHLRQVLLAPVGGRRPVAGLDVNAKGDWTLVVLDESGTPVSGEIKIAAAEKTDVQVAEELGAELRQHPARAIAVGHGKSSRPAVARLREAIRLLNADAVVFVVNDAGLSSYANSELARQELPELTVPARMAVDLGRRFQDPLPELLKVDARHLGLGLEPSLIGKANLRRTLVETIESSVAHVGCDVNHAPLAVLRHVPGLDFEIGKRIVERRAERPFGSREELRAELLSEEPRWTNAAAFLRVSGSSEPLDATALHPEQYELARTLLERAGAAGAADAAGAIGRRELLRGLRRDELGVDEATWRDLVRELGHPGRDPRLRLFPPDLLAPDHDPAALEKDRVVEGIVTSVASFGAFVDLGIPREAMIHISEVSQRYVRDARGLLSIGQVVRARVLDGSGQRIELSLKSVPPPPRRPRPPAAGGAGPARGRGTRPRREAADGRREPAGERKPEAWSEVQPVVRAARSRRDGLVRGDDAGSGRGRGRGAGGGGRGRSGAESGGRGAASGAGRRPGGPARRGGRGQEPYDPDAVRRASRQAGSYNPFATFFKTRREEEGETEDATGGETG